MTPFFISSLLSAYLRHFRWIVRGISNIFHLLISVNSALLWRIVSANSSLGLALCENCSVLSQGLGAMRVHGVELYPCEMTLMMLLTVIKHMRLGVWFECGLRHMSSILVFDLSQKYWHTCSLPCWFLKWHPVIHRGSWTIAGGL